MKIQLGALVAGKGATEPEENPENTSLQSENPDHPLWDEAKRYPKRHIPTRSMW